MDPALERLQKSAERLDIDSWNYVKSYADRINLRPTDTDNLFDNLIKSSPVGYKLGQRPVAKLSRSLRQMVYRGTLGLNIGSAIRNLTQGTNTYAQLGEKYTAQGYLKAVKSIVSKSDELEKVGVLRNSFIEDRGLSATKKTWEKIDKGLFLFFEAAEKINRGSAYFGAKAKALANGASEQDAIKAGVDMARKTQFTFGSVDTPVKLQSDLVKLLTQFQSFNIKQTEFLSEMAKNKEYAGMLRWAGANVVILFTVGQAMGWDWKDMIPFGGVLDGQSPIGSSPTFTLAKDVAKVATGGTDKYGNPIKPEQIAKDFIPLIPAGVQINKTISGLKDVTRGYDESATGRIKFPIAQTPRNFLQGGVLGSYNLPEAKAYRKAEGSVMGEKQSATFKTLSPQDQLKYFTDRNARLDKGEAEGSVTPTAIPTDQDDFNELYKQAKSKGTGFPKDKMLIDNDPTLTDSEKAEKIQKLKDKTAQWAELLIKMEDQHPEKIRDAGIDTYKSGGGATVEERSNWVKTQLDAFKGTPEERQAFIDDLWDEKVLTSGTKGTFAALEAMGIDVSKYTGNNKKIKASKTKKLKTKKYPKITVKPITIKGVKLSSPNLKTLKVRKAPKLAIKKPQKVAIQAPKSKAYNFSIIKPNSSGRKRLNLKAKR
jgi:hypothetical protein